MSTLVENFQQDTHFFEAFEARLIAKAWEHETFKQELLTNPRAVIERESGLKIPEGIEVCVHEETATALHLVLPRNPDELDDHDPGNPGELFVHSNATTQWNCCFKILTLRPGSSS